MSAFKDQLALDRDRIFLNADEMADDIIRLVHGEQQDQQPLVGIVDWSIESGYMHGGLGKQILKDMEDTKGRRTERFCLIDLKADQEIFDDDRFIVPRDGANVLVQFLRPVGADNELKTLLCAEPGNRTTRQSRTRT